MEEASVSVLPNEPTAEIPITLEAVNNLIETHESNLSDLEKVLDSSETQPNLPSEEPCQPPIVSAAATVSDDAQNSITESSEPAKNESEEVPEVAEIDNSAEIKENSHVEEDSTAGSKEVVILSSDISGSSDLANNSADIAQEDIGLTKPFPDEFYVSLPNEPPTTNFNLETPSANQDVEENMPLKSENSNLQQGDAVEVEGEDLSSEKPITAVEEPIKQEAEKQLDGEQFPNDVKITPEQETDLQKNQVSEVAPPVPEFEKLCTCAQCGTEGKKSEYIRNGKFCSQSCALMFSEQLKQVILTAPSFAPIPQNQQPQMTGNKKRKLLGKEDSSYESMNKARKPSIDSVDIDSGDESVNGSIRSARNNQVKRKEMRNGPNSPSSVSETSKYSRPTSPTTVFQSALYHALFSLRDTPANEIPIGWEKHSKNLIPSNIVLDELTFDMVLKWSPKEVSKFVEKLSGCQRLGYTFEEELIDGEAFLLLTQPDLTKILGLKLGPAIKIYNMVHMLREALVYDS